MANCIMIMGPSGSGKSSSIRNLDPKTTFIISVLNKPLPFKGYKKSYIPIVSWEDVSGNYYASDDWIRIKKCIEMIQERRPDIKVLVIDDVQYILANEFMNRSHEKSFDKFSEMANHYWQIIRDAQKCRDDLVVFFLSHNEVDSTGFSKVKTIGKLLDDKITIDGMFTTLLLSSASENGFKFMTQGEGYSTAKTPPGMFPELYVDNDLKLIADTINEYNNDEE